MTNEILNRQTKQTHGVRDLLNKYNVEDPNKNKVKRDKLLTMLKNRYGYSNEKATDELERLLKIFYRKNSSSGVRRSQAKSKQSGMD